MAGHENRCLDLKNLLSYEISLAKYYILFSKPPRKF